MSQCHSVSTVEVEESVRKVENKDEESGLTCSGVIHLRDNSDVREGISDVSDYSVEN